LVFYDADSELHNSNFWAAYGVAQIVSEAMMLDVKNITVALKERHKGPMEKSNDATPAPRHPRLPSDPNEGQPSESAALLSEVEIPSISTSDLSTSSPLVPLDSSDIPPNVMKALSSQQREILLLKDELAKEQWLSRENVKHIGRLFQDKILAKVAEAERQGLVSDCVRNYENKNRSNDWIGSVQ
jgi:hypothetical protein